MRSGSLALRAAGVAVVLALAPAAGGAYAHDGVRVTVTPATARPGSDVEVRVAGCEGATGVATSPAFVAEAELTGRGGDGHPLFGDTTARSGLKDGTYQVAVRCDGHDHRDAGTIRVQGHPPTRHPTDQPTHEPSPLAPVRAGGGGAAAFAAPAAPGVAQTVAGSGLGTPYTLVGLAGAGIAAVAVACRSARRRRADTAPRADRG
ncbi:hypothetical protein [Streptomyces sp. NBC_01216]|uniref:hypothetical protein n=1 Tax=unclassified Streptomyces TaxID=2593676 RepID=UPI002E0E7B18|nr:hypothetical protein OG393_20740 [Streptomyces sp. NBC_01216]